MKYDNEVMKCLYERASVRSYTDQDVSPEVLRKIIDAGCHAATGGNLQPYSIIEIRSQEKKEALMDTKCMQPIVRNAPVNLLFCIDWHRIENWAKANHAPYAMRQSYRHFWISFQDTIIAAQNVCTAADSMGLGSVYIGTVESCFEEVKSIFNLPEGVFPVVILSLGYPTKYPEPAPKLLYDDIVHQEAYVSQSADVVNDMMNKKYSGRRAPLSDKNLDLLHEVTATIFDKEKADEAINYAKELGYIHPVQRYFGLHYVAHELRKGNQDFLNSLRSSGYEWLDRDF